MQDPKVVRPHPGPQTDFLASPADIVIYGGAAGGGKSYGLLLEPLRHVSNARFDAVCFRREAKQVTNPGGLWDKASELYPLLGATPHMTDLAWDFTSGARVKFAHLEHESDKFAWQGTEVPLIEFDELTHFSRSTFLYLLSRNRSTCGVRPYLRASTNPDPDSWVRDLIDWWIGPDGFPVPKRSGVLRWFVVMDGRFDWADSAKALRDRYPGIEPKSLTFIPAKLQDNPTLMQADPGYLANLQAQEEHVREQLLGGNWNARPKGKLYSRAMFKVLDVLPKDIIKQRRGWDIAATEKTAGTDPDLTAGVKVCKTSDGRFGVVDMIEDRWEPDGVEAVLVNTAKADGSSVSVSIPQDPGAAGKIVANRFIRLLSGFDVVAKPQTGSKVERGRPFLAQVKAGNVWILQGPWNRRFFECMEAFGTTEHDDVPDATHSAFNDMEQEPEVAVSFI